MVYSANLCVNPPGADRFLDVLDLGEISSFLDWKHQYVPILKGMALWMGTD